MSDRKDLEIAALAVLKSTGIDVLEAALIAKEALAANHGRPSRARRCIALGAEVLRQQRHTVSFAKAVATALEVRSNKRARTRSDFRYITRRFMKRCLGLATRRVRSITAQDCARYIETAFDTPRQRQKARLVLSGVFSTARRFGWCSENPVAQVETPNIVEKRIQPLQPEEIERLLDAAKAYNGGKCLAAVGLMLYAGIRPHEVTRLQWKDINLQERCICIQPQHSKTGGARLVTIHPPLEQMLTFRKQHPEQLICPPQWILHWRAIRHGAGFAPQHWVQDVLRHTYASYHAAYFRNLPALQLEMGHRDCSLLRTRYMAQANPSAAKMFWAHTKQTPGASSSITD